MRKRNVINSLQLYQQKMKHLKFYQDEMLKQLLLTFGAPFEEVSKFITGEYHCVMYIPIELKDHLEGFEESVLNCKIFQVNPNDPNSLNIELHKVIDGKPNVRLYRLTIPELQFKDYMKEYLKFEDKPYIVGIDPYEGEGSGSMSSDKMLAMAMALQHGTFKKEE